MNWSNKDMDNAVEMAEADTARALANRSNNGARYVAGRFEDLHVNTSHHVKVRNGVDVGAKGRLFPASRHSERDGDYEIRSAPLQEGIIATLMDESSGEVADYHVQTNGLNGVEVTGKV